MKRLLVCQNKEDIPSREQDSHETLLLETFTDNIKNVVRVFTSLCKLAQMECTSMGIPKEL